MNCDESRQLLAIDADGELDLIRHLELSAHLKTCPACADRAQAIRAHTSALQAALPRYGAPPGLAAKINLSLSKPGAAGTARLPSTVHSASALWPLWQYGGVAALFLVSLLIGYRVGHRQSATRQLFDEAIDDHVRSLDAGHLTDVASTDQHTVKPWFAGKLDFSPPVIDLSTEGFPLFGGRLERLNGRAVAALVFHRHQHTLNLFIWPASAASLSPGHTEHEGYRTDSWSQNGFNFLVVSDLTAADLALFAQMYRAEH